MDYQEVLAKAREHMGAYCKACPVCNGKACRNQIPGPGAKGTGDTAIRNYEKWQEIRLNMDTLCESGPADTSLELFGRTFRYPFFAGPVGAVNLHYSEKYSDQTYNRVLVKACRDNGIAAFTGDGTNPEVMRAAAAAIKEAQGFGVPTVKPWNETTVKEKMDLCRESGCFAMATDIGYAADSIRRGLQGADFVLVEANHDLEMLMGGSYPVYLKRRIASDEGHLSNEDCGGLCLDLVQTGCEHFLLGHLSSNNNLPSLAVQAVCGTLMQAGIRPGEVTVDVAPRLERSPLFEFGRTQTLRQGAF